MRVLIAGGGIGGMAAAISLRREGHEPVVLEQAPALGFVGQGIGLGANALKGLRYLGAFDRLRERAVPTRGWRYHSITDGAEELDIVVADRYGGEQYVSAHRADLLDALVEQLDQDDVRLGVRVVEVEENAEGVSVVLDDGSEVRGDLLIGADGVKSVVRRRFVDHDDSHFSHFVAWRAAIPADAAPETAKRRELRMFSGSAKFCILYPIREDLVNLSAYVPAVEAEAESWSAGGDPAELRAVFADACPEVQLALSSLDNALLTGVFVRDPLPHWVTRRTALLGDSAHAMGPFSGNGGGAAIEDAVTLGIMLRGLNTADEAAAALREYEQRRMPRLTQLMAEARGRLAYLNDAEPSTPRARTGLFAGLQNLDPGSRQEFSWLYGHDAVAAAETPFGELGLDGANPMSRPAAQRAFELWKGALVFHDHAAAWKGRRRGYERFQSETFPVPDDVAVTDDVVAGVPVLRVTAPGADGGLRGLHLHGGGFMMGSARGAAEYAARLSVALGGEVVVPDYRLAPEHGGPAAAEDVLAVYRELAAGSQHPIVVSGEDAGGGFAVGLAVAARDAGDPLPAALFLVSPFADLTVSAAGLDAAGRGDPWLNRPFATVLAATYVQSSDPASPAISPAFADLRGLPPMLVCAAAGEALVDDATALAASARAAGVPVEEFYPEDSVHSFVLFDFLDESAEALRRLGALVARAA